MSDLRIGVIRGSLYFERFDKDNKLIKEYTSTNLQNFNKLIAGRVDVVIRTEMVGDYLVKSGNFSNNVEKANYKFSNHSPTYFVISRKSPFMARIKMFERNLQRLKENDLVLKITNKWLK